MMKFFPQNPARNSFNLLCNVTQGVFRRIFKENMHMVGVDSYFYDLNIHLYTGLQIIPSHIIATLPISISPCILGRTPYDPSVATPYACRDVTLSCSYYHHVFHRFICVYKFAASGAKVFLLTLKKHISQQDNP